MSKRIAAAAAVVAVCCVLAFLALDPIVASFIAIVLVTGLVVVVLARDWDQHSTYEEREQLRTLRRKEKWERNQSARDRDRARWEAHQARQAAKSDGSGTGQ